MTFVSVDGTRTEADVVDLATGGMFIRTDQPLAADSRLLLEIRAPDETDTRQAFGRVVWTRGAGAAGAPAGMGIQLISPDPGVVETLTRLAEWRALPVAAEEPNPHEMPTTMNIVPQLVVKKEVRDDAVPPPRPPAASVAIDLLPKVTIDLVHKKADAPAAEAPPAEAPPAEGPAADALAAGAPTSDAAWDGAPEPTAADIPRRRDGRWLLLALLAIVAAAAIIHFFRDQLPWLPAWLPRW